MPLRRTGLRRARIRKVGAIDFSSGVLPGTYGTSTAVPEITVDRFGRVVFALNVPIAIPIDQLLPIPANTVIGNPTGADAIPSALTMPQLRASLGPAGIADLWRAAQGILAETAPHNVCGFISPPGPTNSVVYLTQVFLLGGVPLTKAAISTSQTSPGVQSAGFLGLYASGTFAKVAATASVGNAWQAAAGNLQFANLTAVYTPPTTGIYYAAFLAVFTGQAPNILMAMPPQTGGGGAGAVNGLYYLTHNVVTATLPATIVPATATFAPIIPWIGFF